MPKICEEILPNLFRLKIPLPGHRRLIKKHRDRIDELKQHHSERLAEVLRILFRGNQNAYQVASRMSWDIDSESWEQFPVAQRWFTTGEAISQLRFLKEAGELFRKTSGNTTLYSVIK